MGSDIVSNSPLSCTRSKNTELTQMEIKARIPTLRYDLRAIACFRDRDMSNVAPVSYDYENRRPAIDPPFLSIFSLTVVNCCIEAHSYRRVPSGSELLSWANGKNVTVAKSRRSSCTKIRHFCTLTADPLPCSPTWDCAKS